MNANTKKSKTLSQKGSKIAKDERDKTRANVKEVLAPAMLATRSDYSKLLANTVDAARSIPHSYPDAQSPYTTTAHHRLINEITSTGTNQNFAIIASGDPAALLGVYQDGLAPVTTNLNSTSNFDAGYSAFASGTLSAFTGGLPVQTEDESTFVYGGLATTATTVNLISAPQIDDRAAFVFVDQTGSRLENNDAGAYKISDVNVTGTATFKFFMHMSNPNGSVNITFSVDGSADGISWVNIGSSSAAEAFDFGIQVSGSYTAIKYFRIQMSNASASSITNPRSITQLVMAATLSSAAPTAYTTYPIQNLSGAQALTRAFRIVALNMLVSCFASDFNNSGSLAGVQIDPEYEQATIVPDYFAVSSLPNAYNGPLKHGTFGWWLPRSASDMSFQKWTDSKPALPVLVVAGIMGQTGATMRIQVDCIIEWITEAELLAPRPSRCSVLEIESRAQIMSMIPCHFVQNDMHTVVQSLIRKAESIYNSAKPYAIKLYEIAKVLAPVGAAMLAL
jgi:hypothetical protein